MRSSGYTVYQQVYQKEPGKELRRQLKTGFKTYPCKGTCISLHHTVKKFVSQDIIENNRPISQQLAEPKGQTQKA